MKATLALKNDSIGKVSHERIALLEAVAREGSISAAARAVGLTYKAAWDGLDAMQNLVSQPLLNKTSGGRRGGGATLTPAGLQLIETFHQLESGLATMLHDAARQLDDIGLNSAGLLQGFMMRTSARNLLAGTIEKIENIDISARVKIRLSDKISISAHITGKSVERLGLVEGRGIAALIKAPFILISPDNINHTSAMENRIKGKIIHIEHGNTTSEITIDIGADKTLIASLATVKADELALTIDQSVTASFDANHVIIATY